MTWPGYLMFCQDLILHECTPRFKVSTLVKFLGDLYTFVSLPLPQEVISPHHLGRIAGLHGCCSCSDGDSDIHIVSCSIHVPPVPPVSLFCRLARSPPSPLHHWGFTCSSPFVAANVRPSTLNRQHVKSLLNVQHARSQVSRWKI